jgi:hypothetical protein
MAESALSENNSGVSSMTIHLNVVPIVSLIAGVLILVQPKLLNYIVALYLIIIGTIGLIH